MSNHKYFDGVLNALSAFEEGMAKNTLRRKSEVIAKLNAISNETTTLQNQGKLPQGTKSSLSKISKLVRDTISGLETGVFSNLTAVREVARDHFGRLHSTLRQQLDGGLNAEQKELVRENYANDEDKFEELKRLVGAFDPGTLLINGVKVEKRVALANVTTFLNDNFTLSQLRSIRPLKEDGTNDPDSKWNQISYPEIWAAMQPDAKGKAKLSALKRELVQKHDDDLAQLSESYKELVRRLPRSLRVPFAAVYYPVIPVFHDLGAYKPGRLEHAGFKVKWIGTHFPVLEDQFLLCVDLDKIGIKDSVRMTRDGERMKTVNNDGELAKAVQGIIDQINETARHSGQSFSLASDTIVRNPNNPRIALVWLIDSRVRKQLHNLLDGKTKTTWDIPRHNMEATKLKHGDTPAATQKLIDASYAKHHGNKQKGK